MPSYVTPRRNVAWVGYIGLVSQADTKLLKASPTLAAGDVKVEVDGVSLGNITTLPTVTPAAGRSVKVSLSATEMDGDNVVVQFTDVAGAEWCDQMVSIQTTAKQIDELATPTNITAGVITTVTNLTNAPTAGDLTATMKTSVTTAASAATPVATVSGDLSATMKASVTAAVPTAIQNADALLDRNMATGSDSGSPTVRTVRQALRFLRNKWTMTGGVLSVKKEDDTTDSWTAAATQTPGNPVSSVDPT